MNELLPDDVGPDWGVLSAWARRTGRPHSLAEELPTAPTFARLFVSRDRDGAADGILYVDEAIGETAGRLIVIVRFDRRRLGIASRLYGLAHEAGVDVEALSGAAGLTADGAAFYRARQARQARRHAA